MSFEFYPLGVGDAFTADWYSTCLALRAEGQWLLIDCPHPIRKMMKEADCKLDVGDVSGVVLTHMHADHCSGLEGFAFFSHFVHGRPVKLLAHDDVAEPMWTWHFELSMGELIDPEGKQLPLRGFEDYFKHIPIEPGKKVQFGPFTIESRMTVHHIPTTALRITAAGRTLGHSADTAFDPELITWLNQAHTIIHETNYGAHTPYHQLAALPEGIRRKMKLIHYPDDFDREMSIIEPLVQGKRYVV